MCFGIHPYARQAFRPCTDWPPVPGIPRLHRLHLLHSPVQAMPVVPVTQQTEHRVKEQSLKHESPLSGADDFTLLV